MADEKKELNEANENNVSGGYLFDAHGCGHDEKAYEIIGKKGEILKRFTTRDDAVKWADKENISSKRIYWPELARLREVSDVDSEERKKEQEKIIANYHDLLKQVEDYKNKWGEVNR